MNEKDHETSVEVPVVNSELNNDELDKVTGGSQSTGSGAGKATHNEFSITRKVDSASPKLF
jgi:bacteriocin-like protein